MLCNQCGKEIREDATFCPYCGAKCAGDNLSNTAIVRKPKRGILIGAGIAAAILLLAIIGSSVLKRPSRDEAPSEASTENAEADSSAQAVASEASEEDMVLEEYEKTKKELEKSIDDLRKQMYDAKNVLEATPVDGLDEPVFLETLREDLDSIQIAGFSVEERADDIEKMKLQTAEMEERIVAAKDAAKILKNDMLSVRNSVMAKGQQKTKEEQAEAPREESTSTSIDLNWHTLTGRETYDGGYEFEKTMVLSPWINATNKDAIEAYWSKVSTQTFYGKQPTMWKNGGDAETWYLIGYYMQKNVTSGFTFSESNPHGTPLRIAAALTLKDQNGFETEGFLSLVVYFSNGLFTRRTLDLQRGITSPSGLGTGITHTSDTWGPVPICFVVFNPISPENPNGLDITLTQIKLAKDAIYQITDFCE